MTEDDKILVTGAAGFIGMHVCRYLLKKGKEVVGIDNLSPYYDVKLKKDRLRQLAPYAGFVFKKTDIADRGEMNLFFKEESFKYVINLAAQPGVRYSIENPHSYIDSNILGFINILEGCRRSSVRHLVYASSSSVYGLNTKIPFSVRDNADHPVSLYGATKRANELMAHAYSHLYNLPTTGLRFFTVYGPWGRPDMAPILFTKAILENKPINVFNNGKLQRDFTYVDDIVEGVVRVLTKIPAKNPNFDKNNPFSDTSCAPYSVYNIGNNKPVALMEFIQCLENALGKKAIKNMLPMQAGDMVATCADIDSLKREVGFSPDTPLVVGAARFVEWYKNYY